MFSIFQFRRFKMQNTVVVFLVLVLVAPLAAQPKHEITISGTSFLLNGEPFPYTGISFMNAIYNPAFNKGSPERREWMKKFQRYGINVLRIYAQWDGASRGYADACAECNLFYSDGRLRDAHLARVKEILADADALGMVIQLEVFHHIPFREGRLGATEAERAKSVEQGLTLLTPELLPYRNVTFQIYSEMTFRTVDLVKVIKAIDPKRLITSAPGGASVLGSREENEALDFLTPHTSRQSHGRHWEIVPREIAYLIARYKKPVVDDEPARNGTSNFGGPPDGEVTYPYDQILQIYQVMQVGGYITYHHDMFQTGYGTPSVPPHGIPDPEFNAYHRFVLEFIAQRERYRPFRDGTPARRVKH
jgi:hypothetical protein